MQSIENHVYSLSSFFKKSERAIESLQREKNKNISILDHDIKLAQNTNVSLKDFKSFTSNQDDYQPTKAELNSLVETFQKQKTSLESIYENKINAQKEYMQKIKESYSNNGLSVVSELAHLTKDLF